MGMGERVGREKSPRDPSWDAALGGRVAELRRSLALSQLDLAIDMRGLGFPWYPQTVQQIEGGGRTLTWTELEHLAWYFDVPMLELLEPVLTARPEFRRSAVERPWANRKRGESREDARGRIRSERLVSREANRFPGPTFVINHDVGRRAKVRMRDEGATLFGEPAEGPSRRALQQTLDGFLEGEPHVARDELEAELLKSWERAGLVRQIRRQQAQRVRAKRGSSNRR
jgi:transcriptional regulator with XRE-family HTH domain